MATRSTPEKQIENAILDYLSTRLDVFAWKNQTVGIFDPKRNVFRKAMGPHQIRGVSDILGMIKPRGSFHAVFLAIEVKTPKGETTRKTYPSKYQKEFLSKVRDAGGLALVARSIDDVIQALPDSRV